MKTDVIIVGAGIGGAILALALARRGWKVKLLERDLEPPRIIRPEILWGATPAALDHLEVGNLIREESVRLEGIVATRGEKPLIGLDRSLLDAARVEPYSTDPAMTRSLIAEAALATGNVGVERGMEVTDVIREGARVVGVRGRRQQDPFEETASLVVGDDGVYSVVRESCEISIRLEIFPFDFVTAGIQWPGELAANQTRVWLNAAALRAGVPVIAFIPWPGGRGVALVPLPHQRAERLLQSAPEKFWSELDRLTPLCGSLARQLRFPDDFRRVRRPYGHASSYVTDGAAIIGDAAHPMSPAGGQGANASIWDALALAEVADDALAADDPSRERLRRYERLRRKCNSGSVSITVRAAQVQAAVSWLPRIPWLVPTALRLADRTPSLKRHVVRAFATRFVTRLP